MFGAHPHYRRRDCVRRGCRRRQRRDSRRLAAAVAKRCSDRPVAVPPELRTSYRIPHRPSRQSHIEDILRSSFLLLEICELPGKVRQLDWLKTWAVVRILPPKLMIGISATSVNKFFGIT